MNDEVMQIEPQLLPPTSRIESKDSSVNHSQERSPSQEKSARSKSKRSKRGLEVCERLFALGKLYEAKKEVMRDR